MSSGSPPLSEAVYDYSRLVWSDDAPAAAGANANRLEAHLSDGQFREVLGVDRYQFYALSVVEQMRVKQVGLSTRRGRWASEARIWVSCGAVFCLIVSRLVSCELGSLASTVGGKYTAAPTLRF